LIADGKMDGRMTIWGRRGTAFIEPGGHRPPSRDVTTAGTRWTRLIWGVALACSCHAGAAEAAQPCAGVDTNMSPERKQEYAALVTKAMTAKIKPSAVKILNYMEAGSWSAVYASTPASDDGVFFFQDDNNQKTFKDVWGGWADPSEKPELIRWARKLGAPQELSKCFADVVTRN
jgi:hypothetical protein